MTNLNYDHLNLAGSAKLRYKIISASYMVAWVRLNYETLELNIPPEEAQLSYVGAQYSCKEAQIYFQIMEYEQRLYIYNARRQIIAQYHRNLPFIST